MSKKAVKPIKIKGGGDISIEFNVMPNRQVKEDFLSIFYEVSENKSSAVFDRRYLSSMKASPSHVIFLTMLIQLQKLTYLTVACKLGLNLNLENEVLKIWPIDLKISLPAMETRESDLTQHFKLNELRLINQMKYFAKGVSWIQTEEGKLLTIEGTSIVQLH